MSRATWGDLHRPGAVAPRPLGRASLGAFFELALGLTAWKEHGGARWALRANPSSGNLHPTEGYLLVAAADRPPRGPPPLPEPRPRPRAALGAVRPGHAGAGAAPRRFPGRPRVHPLARGLEVRRAGLPLLPARRGPRARRRPLRGGGAGLGGSPPRHSRRRRRVRAPRTRSRERRRRPGARGPRAPRRPRDRRAGRRDRRGGRADCSSALPRCARRFVAGRGPERRTPSARSTWSGRRSPRWRRPP